MNTEALVLVVTLAVIGIPAVVAMFLISKALGTFSAASKQVQFVIEKLSETITQASNQSIQTSIAITKLEQRVAEALNLIDIRSKEDRQIAQSIAFDNRQALRDTVLTIKEPLNDLKERIVNFSEVFKAEIIETRKWDTEKATERLKNEMDYQGQIAEKIVSALHAINERMDSVSKQISEKIDQGSRLSQRTVEAKTEELIIQLKGIPAIQDEIRNVASQLEQNRAALEQLRTSIVDDVTTLTGD